MPIYKTKNEDFFKKWSPKMAYVLGFFMADGSLVINPRGAKYLSLSITDGDLLIKIREALGSNHKIAEIDKGERCKTVYRLQIGSKEMFKDLLRRGLRASKDTHKVFSNIPKAYLKDFIRGYFDGDGGIWHGLVHKNRKKPTRTITSTFTSCNENILQNIAYCLYKIADMRLKKLVFLGGAFRLSYSVNDSRKLYKFMYNKIDNTNGLFLKRKKDVFEKFINNDMRM